LDSCPKFCRRSLFSSPFRSCPFSISPHPRRQSPQPGFCVNSFGIVPLPRGSLHLIRTSFTNKITLRPLSFPSPLRSLRSRHRTPPSSTDGPFFFIVNTHFSPRFISVCRFFPSISLPTPLIIRQGLSGFSLPFSTMPPSKTEHRLFFHGFAIQSFPSPLPPLRFNFFFFLRTTILPSPAIFGRTSNVAFVRLFFDAFRPPSSFINGSCKNVFPFPVALPFLDSNCLQALKVRFWTFLPPPFFYPILDGQKISPGFTGFFFSYKMGMSCRSPQSFAFPPWVKKQAILPPPPLYLNFFAKSRPVFSGKNFSSPLFPCLAASTESLLPPQKPFSPRKNV